MDRIVLLLALVVICKANSDWLQVTNSWNGGFEGDWVVKADNGDLNGWKVTIKFDRHIDKLEVWKATVVQQSDKEFVLQATPEYAHLSAGQQLKCHFVARAPGGQPASGYFSVEGTGSGSGSSSSGGNTGGTSTGTGSTDTGTGSSGGSTGTSSGGSEAVSQMRHDYGEAMKLSILFYDAQRSGKLPANNPIPWRGDSAMGDNGDGHDLTGGWYDAGDHVKFGLPMAFSSWALNFGFIKFPDAYEAKGQTQMMCDMVRSPLEYFLKCWEPSKQKFWAQVGDGNVDHNYWGRPENMPRDMYRPALSVSPGEPGADIVADTVSAMASGYLVFKDICGDTGFANKLLEASKSLYDFMGKVPGVFVKDRPFYGDDSDRDEKFTAGAWMYMATKQDRYLNDAKSGHVTGTPWNFMWGEKTMGGTLLLYEITQDNSYRQQIIDYVRSFMPGGSVPYTPCGLAFRDQWGSNRHAANAAFVAVVAAELGINPDEYKKWAMTQMNYILGDNKLHISYEIGFGSNYPKRPHHRGRLVQVQRSCRRCIWMQLEMKPLYVVENIVEKEEIAYYNSCQDWGCPDGDNPNVLKGAIVGGPDQNDNYNDRRDDYKQNEVATDYNAGFQGCLAGLYHFAVKGNLPASPQPKC